VAFPIKGISGGLAWSGGVGTGRAAARTNARQNRAARPNQTARAIHMQFCKSISCAFEGERIRSARRALPLLARRTHSGCFSSEWCLNCWSLRLYRTKAKPSFFRSSWSDWFQHIRFQFYGGGLIDKVQPQQNGCNAIALLDPAFNALQRPGLYSHAHPFPDGRSEPYPELGV